MDQWWECPNCGEKVSFNKQMFNCFDYGDGSADFSPESGIFFHTITCECGAYWVMSLSEMHHDKDNQGTSNV